MITKRTTALLMAISLTGCFAATDDRDVRSVYMYSECDGNIVTYDLDMNMSSDEIQLQR